MKRSAGLFLFAVILMLVAGAVGAQVGPLDSPLEIEVTRPRLHMQAWSQPPTHPIARWSIPDFEIANDWDIDVFYFISGGWARWQTVPMSRGWVELESTAAPVMFEARNRDLLGTLPCVVIVEYPNE